MNSQPQENPIGQEPSAAGGPEESAPESATAGSEDAPQVGPGQPVPLEVEPDSLGAADAPVLAGPMVDASASDAPVPPPSASAVPGPPPSASAGTGEPPPWTSAVPGPPPSASAGTGEPPPWNADAPVPPLFSPPPPQVPPVMGHAPQPGVRYDVPQDQKNLAMISTLGMIIVGFLSPLIVFVLTNGDPSKKFANDHAKEGLNFCISMFAASLITVLLLFLIVGFLLIPLLFGWGLWVVIAGTIQANNGEAPNFPLVPKILK